MAAGDLLRSRGISMIEAGAAPSFTPTTNQSKWAKEEGNAKFYYFDTSWKLIDLGFSKTYSGSILPTNSSELSDHLQALETAIESFTTDGNLTQISRSNSTEDVAPTSSEVPSPQDGDTANISLTSQKVEAWSYSSGTWTKNYVVDHSTVVIPIETVTDSNSVELLLTGTDLTANIKTSSSQDNEFEIIELSDGIRITRQILPIFQSFSAAQVSVNIDAGDAFVLSISNLEGIPSDGATGPVFRKQ